MDDHGGPQNALGLWRPALAVSSLFWLIGEARGVTTHWWSSVRWVWRPTGNLQ